MRNSSNRSQEAIGAGDVIKRLLRLSKTEPVAVEILLELSMNDKIAQKILEAKNSIPILMSLLDNPDSCLENVLAVLKSFSPSISNTLLMAKSGYLAPFLDVFNAQGVLQETPHQSNDFDDYELTSSFNFQLMQQGILKR